MKQSELKTIDIKGKAYVTVAERLRYFNETYPEGSITTELLTKPDAQMILVKATITVPIKNENATTLMLTGQRMFTGHSQAIIGDGYINKTSALENAETSAVGRALGMMGIGIIEAVASADEMVKAGAVAKPRTTESMNKTSKRIEAQDEATIEIGLDEAN